MASSAFYPCPHCGSFPCCCYAVPEQAGLYYCPTCHSYVADWELEESE